MAMAAIKKSVDPLDVSNGDELLRDILHGVAQQLARQHNPQIVETVMRDIEKQFGGVRITGFLPILIMREASERLRKLEPKKIEPVLPVAESVKLDFLRFEFKYILGENLRDRIEKDIKHFATLDPYVASKEDRSYIVRSLYYDDQAFSNYHQKNDGLLKRAKFRLRTYTNNPEDSCKTYLEIKGRYNSLVFKHRVGFNASVSSSTFAGCGDITSEISATINQSPVAEQFRYELERKKLMPIMLIDYIRRPYISKYDPEFRLTFDDHLHGTITNRLFPDPTQDRRILPGYTVLEIKFRDRIPLWFHQIIKNYSLERKSISKVCKGMEVCNMVSCVD